MTKLVRWASETAWLVWLLYVSLTAAQAATVVFPNVSATTWTPVTNCPCQITLQAGSIVVYQADPGVVTPPPITQPGVVYSVSALIPPNIPVYQTPSVVFVRAFLGTTLTKFAVSPVTSPGGGSSASSGTVAVVPANIGSYAPFVVQGGTTKHVFDAPANGRTYLDLKNNSKTETISCDLSGNGAPLLGVTFDVSPGFDKAWEGSATPSGAIDCVSSTSSAAASANLYAGQGLK